MCPRPQYTDLTYMGGTGPYGPMRIIFVVLFRVGKQILNFVGIERSMCPRPQNTDLTYMGGTGFCESSKIIFGNHVYS